MKIEIYDTTLRDGTQGEGVNFSVADKCRIAHHLDALGVDFIEGGWPGSNPRDVELFDAAKALNLKNARITAFGATRRRSKSCETDPSIQALLSAETPAITVFGKSWLLHVNEALRISPEENLEIIFDTVRYLSRNTDFVIYDAEHFFDGYRANPEYAMSTLMAASSAGAKRIVLCDTNGGSLPNDVRDVTKAVADKVRLPLGIHCHNDGELAVANTLAAVSAGATHVQGTINGYGERCGNANLCSVIPNLELKLGLTVLGHERLKKLRDTAHFVSDVANLALYRSAAFVGDSAFAHKGGVHVSAVERNPLTYEHIPPESVGNRRRVLVSDLSGRSNLHAKARELNLQLEEEARVLEELKRLEHSGLEFELADASFELLVQRVGRAHQPYFELLSFKVTDEHHGDSNLESEATVRIKVGEELEYATSGGTGPVHALDQALRRALERVYPSVADVRLVDYKVRVINSSLSGTASMVRVLITSSDSANEWVTVGVSSNIVWASWQALVDAVEYKLMKDGVESQNTSLEDDKVLPAVS